MKEGGKMITITIKPVDFRKSIGWYHSDTKQDCPLYNALYRESYNVDRVGAQIAVIDGKDFTVPFNVWGNDYAKGNKFPSKRINKLAKIAKWRIPFTVPSVTLVLEEI